MIKPHDYQHDLVNKIAKKISEKYNRILIQLSTGGGKTVVFSYLIQRFLSRNTSAKITILVHRDELVTQSLNTLNRFAITNVKVQMIETFCNQIKKHGQNEYDLIIIDECHVGNFKKIFDFYIDTKTIILGFTATPIAATKKDPLKSYYETIVVGMPITELIQRGNLTPCIHYSIKSGLDKKTIKKTAGEYNLASMAQEFSKPKLVDAVVNAYEKHAKGKKTIVFNTTIEHSILVHNCFKDNGYNSRFLDSKATKEERAEILNWFANTPGAILNNVGILTAGFDEPSVICVIFNRSTKSLPLWLQCAGRGARTNPNKDYWLLIDLGDNIQGEGHGYWHQHHDWEQYFLYPDKPGEGAAPMKDCPQCQAMIFMAATKCHVCNYEMPRETVYSDMVMELKIMPDKPIKKNSQIALEEAVFIAASKIKKLNLESDQKTEILKSTLVKLYDQAGWELKPYLLKHLIQTYNYA